MIDTRYSGLYKVTRSALQNATSVASTLLTTESVVASIKEDTPAMPAGGAGGMGYDVSCTNFYKKHKNCCRQVLPAAVFVSELVYPVRPRHIIRKKRSFAAFSLLRSSFYS